MKDIAELTKQLRNKDSQLRRSAVELLGSTEDETVIDALIPVLEDDNRFVRQEVVLALKKIGGSRAIEHLTEALNTEKDGLVRDFITSSLERLQRKESTST
ncbi:HEAT repeat domain-containing protein [Chloroflexota bacterium]